MDVVAVISLPGRPRGLLIMTLRSIIGNSLDVGFLCFSDSCRLGPVYCTVLRVKTGFSTVFALPVCTVACL